MQNERLTANAGGLLLFWLFNCAGKTFLSRLYKEGMEAEKREELHKNEQAKYVTNVAIMRILSKDSLCTVQIMNVNTFFTSLHSFNRFLLSFS